MKKVKIFVLLLFITQGFSLFANGQTEALKKQEDKQIVIADLGQPETNPWVINRKRFERSVAEALGIKLVEADDQNSEEKHVNQAESLIASQPDGLIFNPLTSPAGIQVARLLERNAIPGIAVGRLVVSDYSKDYDGEYFLSQVTQNNKSWGAGIANHAVESGYKKVAMIWNQKGVTSAEEIWKGALEVFENNPQIEVVAESWDRLTRENGQKLTEQYIARFQPGELDAIIVLGAVAGLGSQFALEQADREDIAVITTDIDEQVAQFIKDGKLDFSIGGHWMVGGFGLIQLFDYINGFPIENTQPLFTLISVDESNVDLYEKCMLQGDILSSEDIRNLSRVYNPDADLAGFINDFSNNWESYVK
jgi:ABC-type sugar transport system substrate-binding protein